MMHISNTPYLTIAQALAEDFATRADEADKLGQLPAEDIKALQDSGYLALTIPKKFGGQELSLAEATEAQLTLAQGSTSTAIVAVMSLHIFGTVRETPPWTKEVYAEMCRLVVEEGAVINSVSSEPVMGSPSRGGSFASHAIRSDDGEQWILNGHKTWITGGEFLTHMLVRMRLSNDESGTFLVEGTRPGIRWERTWEKALSLRASDSHDVFFENVRVSAGHLIQRHKPGPPAPNIWFPILSAATYLGAAISARDTIIRYALERIPTALGKPIATLPAIQRQIGELDMALQAAQTLLLDTAKQWQGDPTQRQAHYPRVATAKIFATETAIQVAERALRIAGGNGITPTLPLERFFRDTRAGLTHPPSGDLGLQLLGRAAIDTLKTK